MVLMILAIPSPEAALFEGDFGGRLALVGQGGVVQGEAEDFVADG